MPLSPQIQFAEWKRSGAMSVADAGIIGDNSTDVSASLTTLFTAWALLSGSRIIFPAGTYVIGSDITAPTSLTLAFAPGAVLSPSTGVTVTLNGPVEAGSWQIFGGSGTVGGTFGGARPSVIWWGASGSAKTYTVDTTSGSKVISGLPTGHDFRVGQGVAIVHAGNGPYQAGTTITLQAPTGGSITTQNGGPGATGSLTFYVASLDASGGISAFYEITGTGYTDPTWEYWNKVQWTAATGAASHVVYGATGNPQTGQQGLLAVTCFSNYVDFAQGGSSMGLAYESSIQYPATMPTSSLGQTFRSTVTAVTATTITLADSVPASVTGTTILHDDTTPLNNAMMALAAGTFHTLEVPHETTIYTWGVTQSGLTNTTLRGADRWNSQIKALPGASSNVFDLDSCTSMVFEQLCIDGNKINCPMADLSDNEELNNGIRFTNAIDCRVQSCVARYTWMSPIKFGGEDVGTSTGIPTTACRAIDNDVYGGYDQGISVWNSESAVVENNRIKDSGWAGISLTQTNNSVVSNNVSDYNVYYLNAPNSEGHAIAIEGGHDNTISGNIGRYNNAENMHLDVGPYDGTTAIANTISDNTFNYAQRNGAGIFISGAHDTTIKGNQCRYNTGAGIGMNQNAVGTKITGGNHIQYNGTQGISNNSASGAANRMEVTNGNVITHNGDQGVYIDGTGNITYGINVSGNDIESNGQANIDIRGCEDFAVMDNYSTGTTSQGIILQPSGSVNNNYGVVSLNRSVSNGGEGIIVLNGTGLSIIGNKVRANAGSGGINLRGVTNSDISRNQAFDQKNIGGIVLQDNGTTYCTYNTLQGNICVDDQGTPTQTYGIQETGSSNYNRFLDNDCRNNVTSQLVVSGANSIQTNGNQT